MDMEGSSKYQGFIWEEGRLSGCVFLFPAERNQSGICIGTEAEEEPDLLIRSDSYVYFMVGAAESEEPNHYYVINDFDGPVKPANSGDVFRFGDNTFRLL